MKRLLLFLLLCPLLSFRGSDQNEVRYIVIAGHSMDFSALEKTAKKISGQTGIQYHNDLVYDAKRGMIVPDSSDDELYAGAYFPRRGDENRISIEMNWYYVNQSSGSDSTMIIITGVFENKKDAQAQLKRVQKIVPDAYVRKTLIYMGCMH